MNITIIGAGNMARAIATRALAGGTTVTLVGREPGKAQALAAELRGAVQGEASVQVAAAGSSIDNEIVVLAVPHTAIVSVAQGYGDQLAGKIVVDITNPIDMRTLTPAVPPGTSRAEQVAAAGPAGAKVVKAFNTIFAGTLASGQVAGQPIDVFIAGDDAAAKATLSQLIAAGGLRAIDAGPLERARQLEALGLLHMAVQFTLNTGFQTAVKLLVP